MQNYYSNTDVQRGIVQFYNKIASRLINGTYDIIIPIIV